MPNLFMKAGGSSKLLWVRTGSVLSPYNVDDDLTLTGDITANNLSGDNTGDQDLSGYALNGANTDITSLQNTALYVGRDSDNKIDWTTDDHLKITIAGVESDIISISTGTGDNDKLVTQGYVDDSVGGENLWDRDGTTLSPHTAGDDITTTGDISANNLSGTNTGDQDLSGYIPYTGATTNVDLGVYTLTANTLILAQDHYLEMGGQRFLHNGSNFLMNDNLTVGGSESGQSRIASGLIINNDSGNLVTDDFIVKTVSFTDAFVVDASANEILINVPVDLNDKNLTTTGSITANNLEKFESFTLDATDISNKYVDLVGTITNNQSIRIFLDNIGIKVEQGVDYSVSGNQLFWDGYDLQTTLVAGDKLKIFYI